MMQRAVARFILAAGIGLGLVAAAAGQEDAPAATAPAAEVSRVYVQLDTTAGPILLELDAEKAPLTVANFLKYAQADFYDGTIFHRVIPTFMIQGGGYTPTMEQKAEGLRAGIKNEWQNGLKNERGTIAMARLGGQPDSATAQFFINVADNDPLDQPRDGAGYAVFGRVVAGMDVADAIRSVDTRDDPRLAGMGKVVPVKPVVIEDVKILTGSAAEKLAQAVEEARQVEIPAELTGAVETAQQQYEQARLEAQQARQRAGQARGPEAMEARQKSQELIEAATKKFDDVIAAESKVEAVREAVVRKVWPEQVSDAGTKDTQDLFIAAVERMAAQKEKELAELPKKQLEELIAKVEQETGKEFQKTESGLMYLVLSEGPNDAPSPKASDTVQVHYTGWLVNGQKFDSSVDRGTPATFPLSGVIRGWTEGVQLMSVGDKFKFIIPPDIGYGAGGSPPRIPPNATLVFDVELLEIQ